MDGGSTDTAVKRIDAAIVRIERALARSEQESRALSHRYDLLKRAVGDALGEIDALIARTSE
ncbi:MAG: hypothetical protein FJX31_11260 [Alphaproteobacteria bacterium]|nr:hypothetical protein [Alphaproteobacteria bacterium]